MKKIQPERFESMKVTDLIKIEKWLYEYRSIKFNGQAEPFISKDRMPEYEDIQKKIKDVQEAIVTNLSDIQAKSWGAEELVNQNK